MSKALMAEIERAYEHDQKVKAHPVTTRDQLPISYDYITEEWLTDVLCSDHPGAKVVSYQLGSADDGTSNRQKIALQYNSVGRDIAELPRKIFCKAAHNLANRVTVAAIGCADSETNFYQYIRPNIEIETPTCYFGAIDKKSWNAMLILGDISDSVTEFCDHRTVMTKERAMSQMAVLATLHGRCFSDPVLAKATQDHFVPWREFFANTSVFGLEEASGKGFLMSEDLIPRSLYVRAAEIWPGTMKSLDIHDEYPQTLSHHDVHLKNWYVAGNGAMGLGDWQCTARGHWGRDIAYAMTTALTIEDRRAWEEDLLRFYIEELERNGGPAVTFDEVWFRYREQMITALTWWTITINPAPDMPDMQPRDVTEEFIRRIGTAMDDVGTMDALKA